MTRNYHSQRRDDTRPSSRNQPSGRYGESRPPQPARPRLNRETVDRAWENGAQRNHADYHPRQNNGRTADNRQQHDQSNRYGPSQNGRRPYSQGRSNTGYDNQGRGNARPPARPYNDRRDSPNRSYNDNERTSNRQDAGPSRYPDGEQRPRGRYDDNRAPGRRYDNERAPGRRYDDNRPPERRYENSRDSGRRYDDNRAPGRRYDDNRPPERRYENSRDSGRRYDNERAPGRRYDDNRAPGRRYEDNRASDRRPPRQAGYESRPPRYENRQQPGRRPQEGNASEASSANDESTRDEQFEGDYESFDSIVEPPLPARRPAASRNPRKLRTTWAIKTTTKQDRAEKEPRERAARKPPRKRKIGRAARTKEPQALRPWQKGYKWS